MIRSILYLDEQKLFSFSSQVLKGITEYLTKESISGTEATEEQKGPITSGRALAEALSTKETSFERRILHDHAFAILEERLIDSGELQEELLSAVSKASFIRITAPATFVDAAKLGSLLQAFNKLGGALAYSTKHSDITAAVATLEQMKSISKDKSKVASIERQIKEARDPALIARSMGLYQDPTFLESLRLVTEYAYSDHLEIQQKVHNLMFSACLKRDSLRESEDLIMRKYSRKTEKPLVVLGVVTQTAGTNQPPPLPDFAGGSMKEALNSMIELIAALETSMAGKSALEVVVDPVAVYASL